MTQEEFDELKGLFSGKPIDKEWEQMMIDSNNRIGLETNLDFDWDIEEVDKEPLNIEKVQYEPLAITEADNTDEFKANNNSELNKELLNLFA